MIRKSRIKKAVLATILAILTGVAYSMLIHPLFVFSSELPYVQSSLDEIEQEEAVYYTVEKGDFINNIASAHNILPGQLLEANELGENPVIHPGDELLIPNIEWEEREGIASWYGPGFQGRPMANGELYNMEEVLVAHREFPLGMLVRVENLSNGKEIIAPVRDRGPYTEIDGEYNREIDLSRAAGEELDMIGEGIVLVRVTPVY